MAFHDRNTGVLLSGATPGAGAFGCFAASTLIDTPNGARPVEALQEGDLISTLDHGAQPVAWVWNGRQSLRKADRAGRPVLIRAGALAPGRPGRDLIVSPHHHVLVGEAGQFSAGFGQPVLAPARVLTSQRGVRAMMGRKAIHWYGFACKRHEIVCANGVFAGSMLINRPALAVMANRERQQIGEETERRHGAVLNSAPARPLWEPRERGQDPVVRDYPGVSCRSRCST